MKMSRVMTALALIAAIVVSVAGIFLLATSGALAVPQQIKPSSDGYGYGHQSATPSRTRSRTPTPSASSSASSSASPAPSGELPSTGQHTGDLTFAGLASVAVGIVLVVLWWVWQALTRDRHRASERHPLRRP